MSEHERLTDDELAALVRRADGDVQFEQWNIQIGAGSSHALDHAQQLHAALTELQALRRVAYFVTTDEHGDTVSIERIPDTDAEALRAENARLRDGLETIGRLPIGGLEHMDRKYDIGYDAAMERCQTVARIALEGGTDG